MAGQISASWERWKVAVVVACGFLLIKTQEWLKLAEETEELSWPDIFKVS